MRVGQTIHITSLLIITYVLAITMPTIGHDMCICNNCAAYGHNHYDTHLALFYMGRGQYRSSLWLSICTVGMVWVPGGGVDIMCMGTRTVSPLSTVAMKGVGG